MAKQTFQVGVEFLANVSDLQNKIKTVTGDIAKMGSSSGGTQVQKQFDRLTQSVQNLQTRAQQPITSQGEFNKLVSDLNRAEGAYDSLISALDRMRSMSNSQKLELLPADEQAKIQKAAQALQVFDTEAKKAAGSADKLAAANARVVEAQNKATGAKNAWKSISKEYDAAKSKLDQLKAVSLQVGQAQSKLDDAVASGAGEQEIATLRLSLEQAKAAAEKLGVEFQEGISPVNTMKAAVQNLGTEVTKLGTKKTNLGKDYETAKANVTTLKKELTTLEGQLGKTGSSTQLEQAFERLKSKAKELGVDVKGIDDAGQIDELKNRLMQLESQGVERVDASIGELAGSLQGELKNGLNSTRQGLDQAANSFDKFNNQAQEVEQLKSQLGYFFSLTNSVYLLRSALQSAFNTVKELDAVMTETAVVTDFTVGDMWEKLPEYASAAQDLGSSIKDVYAATTLYYQQGLKTEAAMSVGIETMKMARIAGMEASEATQAMTAALRGFNMEVNETNALRVNDVYSNLAAITAADTEQIATAMSKTASIAASANMEFETTAALLAQIIETTQEAPETAGTALKTIIARFSEVKKLQNQGKTTGEDEEGESIEVNKIDKALSSVGISMDAFFAGTEGLDQVLMRLAEKWDTLDFTTQRYIATMAAGSRQQSRFIAMMSDYSRTTELVSAANNSAGASQKQFDKTMESLEAKLKRLKVAWDQFTMNIADDGLIKKGIDLLTGLLNAINKITGSLPGITKSFANLGLVFVSLRAGGLLLNKALAGISGIMAKGFIDAGVVAAKTAETSGEVAGAKMTLGAAKGVNNPVAQAGLFKSYNLLLFKLQSTLPPIQLKATTNPAAVREYQSSLQSLRMEMNKVALAKGKDSAEWKALDAQYQRMLANPVKLAASYSIEGAAVDGLTLKQKQLLGEKVKEGVITKTQLALLGPEAAARVANALAAGTEAKQIEELVWAETTEKNLKAGGLTAFFTEIGLRLTNTTATKAEASGIWGVVKAKLAENAARIKANAAMLTGVLVVAAVIAGVVMLISGISKLNKTFKGMKDGSAELEKINNQLAELTEQTTEAAEEISNIADAKSDLDALQDTFKGLTKGTVEWKQKLVEVNSKVLELLDKYPELAGYIIRGESGELQIQEEGWNVMNEAAYNRYNLMAQSSIGLQTQKTAVEQEIAFEEKQSEYYQNKISWAETMDSTEGKTGAMYVGGGIGLAGGAIAGAKIGGAAGTFWGPLGTIIGGGIGILVGAIVGLGATYLGPMLGYDEEYYQKQATGGLTEKQYTEFAAAAAERGLSYSDTQELHSLYKELGYEQVASWEEVNSKILELGTDFDKLSASALQLELAQKAYVDSFASGVVNNAGLQDSKYAEQIAEITSESYENLDEQIEAKVNSMSKDLSSDQIAQYAALTGKSVDQVNKELKDEAISEETIKTVLATNEVQQEAQQQAKAVAEAMKRLARSTKDVTSLFNILSREGKDIKLQDIEDFKKAQTGTSLEGKELSNITDPEERKKAVENYLLSKGTSLTNLGLTGKNDWQLIWDNLMIGSENFAEASDTASRLGGTIDQRVSSGAAQGFTSKITEQLNQGSKDGVAIMNQVSNLIETNELNAEEAQILYDTLASIDWDNRGEVELLSQKLEENGLDVDRFNNGVKILKDSVIDFSESVYDFTPEQKADRVQQVYDLLPEVSTTKKYTKEEVALFSESEQAKFIQVGNSYVYAGDLTDAGLKNNLLTHNSIVLNTNDASIQAVEDLKKDRTVSTTRVDSTGYSWTGDQAIYSDLVTAVMNDTYAKGYYNLIYGAEEEFAYKKDDLFKGVENYEELFNSWQWSKNLSFTQRAQIDPFATQAYNLWQFNKNHDLPGLPKGATADEVAAWLKNQEDSPFLTSLALGMEPHLLEIQDAFKTETAEIDKYGYEDYVSNAWDTATPDVSVTMSTQDIIDKLVSGEIKTTDTRYLAGEGESVIETEQLIDLVLDIMPEADVAGKTDAELIQLLKNYQDTNIATAKAATETSYFQQFAMEDFDQIYEYATNTDPAYATRTSAAIKYLDGIANSTDGVIGRIQKWKDEEGNLLNQLKLTDTSLKALSLQHDKIGKSAKKVYEVVNKHSEALTKGADAGDEYYLALEQLLPVMQEAFGDHITMDHLKQMGPYLQDIAKGGEAAAKAYKEMAIQSAKLYAIDAMRAKDQGGRGWTQQQATDYTVAIDKLDKELAINPKLNLQDFYNSLGEMSLSYSEFAYALSQNPAYATINIGVKLNADGSLTDSGATTDDVVSSIDWSSIFRGLNSSGGGGSTWKNEHDKQYNNYEKINRLMREREQIEHRYDKLLKKRGVSYKDLLKNQQEQLQNLKDQAATQEKIKSGKAQEIQDLLNSKEGKKYKDYVSYDDKTGQISIDWDKVNKLKGEKGEGFDEFLSKLEGLRVQWQDSQDALDEISDSTDEIIEQGKDDYFDLEGKIKEALIADRQKEIDKLTDIDKSINDTNSKILKSLQDQVDEYRQNRKNEKTEEELSDKQRSLAYLQQDTSGANATKILKLQKEIEEGQESYTDQLIDQKISELQKQNDQAAEQRKRQIDLLESQLKYYKESGAVWTDVYDLINSSDSFLSDGALNPDGPLGKLLKENENFAGMSKLGQIDWWQKISAMFASAILYSKTGRRAQEGETIKFQDAEGNWHEGVADKNGNITVDGKTFTGVHQNEKGEWVTDESGKVEKKEEEKQTKGSGKIASLPSSTKLSTKNIKDLQAGLNELYEDKLLVLSKKLDVDGVYGPKTKAAVKLLQQKIKVPADGIWGPNTKKAFDASSLKAYRAGGLADFTGPAWLDGTKSKPEYILNADQTKAFFTLVDVLSGLTSNTAKSTEKTGDTSFDIDINVESISSDYDVEQIASKIKSLINEDARYRNNNAINLMR